MRHALERFCRSSRRDAAQAIAQKPAVTMLLNRLCRSSRRDAARAPLRKRRRTGCSLRSQRPGAPSPAQLFFRSVFVPSRHSPCSSRHPSRRHSQSRAPHRDGRSHRPVLHANPESGVACSCPSSRRRTSRKSVKNLCPCVWRTRNAVCRGPHAAAASAARWRDARMRTMQMAPSATCASFGSRPRRYTRAAARRRPRVSNGVRGGAHDRRKERNHARQPRLARFRKGFL